MFRFVERLWASRITTAFRVRGLSIRASKRSSQVTTPHCSHHGRSPILSTALLAFSLPFFKKKEPEEEMKEAWALGLYYIHNGEFSRAEERLHVVHGILAEQFERGEITELEYQGKRARVTSEMANLALLTGALKKSERLLVSTIRDCAQCGLDQRGPEIVELSLKLAQVMAAVGRAKEAESGFRFCVESMKTSLSEKSEEDEDEVKNRRALLGISASAYSKFLQSKERFPEALQMVMLARQEAKKVYEETHEVPISLMADEATLRSEVGDVESAEKIFREAIEVVEFRPDLLIHLLPILYTNLGAVLFRVDRLKESQEAATVALQLLKDLPESHQNEETKRQADGLLVKLAALKAKRVKENST